MSLLKCACLFNSLCEVRFIPRAVLFVIRVLRICCYFYLSKEGGCFAEAQHDNGVIPGNARGSSINLRVTGTHHSVCNGVSIIVTKVRQAVWQQRITRWINGVPVKATMARRSV